MLRNRLYIQLYLGVYAQQWLVTSKSTDMLLVRIPRALMQEQIYRTPRYAHAGGNNASTMLLES